MEIMMNCVLLLCFVLFSFVLCVLCFVICVFLGSGSAKLLPRLPLRLLKEKTVIGLEILGYFGRQNT